MLLIFLSLPIKWRCPITSFNVLGANFKANGLDIVITYKYFIKDLVNCKKVLFLV